MIRRIVLVAITAMSLLVGLGGRASAQAQYGLIPIQGYLTDTLGTPIDGIRQMSFGVYAAEVDGIALYSETQNVSVQHGHFTAYIGDAGVDGGLPLSIFREQESVWGHVTVGTDTGLPRWEVGVASYAAVADYAREANSAATCDWSGSFASPMQRVLPSGSIASESPVAVGSATLDTLVPGVVWAMYTGDMSATGGTGYAQVAICDSANTFDLGTCPGVLRSMSVAAGAPRGVSLAEVFAVTAGTHTFYLNAATDFGYSSPYLSASRLALVFIPQ